MLHIFELISAPPCADSRVKGISFMSSASGVKVFLCGHGKGHRDRRDIDKYHRISATCCANVGWLLVLVRYGGPARGQARKLPGCDANTV